MNNAEIHALTEDQLRQFIDAETSFRAAQHAWRDAQDVRGSMFWRHENGVPQLVRATTRGAQTRLGPQNADTTAIFERFATRKAELQSRLVSLNAAVERSQRLNRALRVGRCPNVLIAILNQLTHHGVANHFITVGTHALYAYEAAAGVRLSPTALATQDIDILFDARKRLTFLTQLSRHDVSFIDILKKADKSFTIMPDQLQTAVNAQGFEVDVLRRMAQNGDEHPMRMSADEGDLWSMQVGSGEALLSARRFSQMVVASNGSMARLDTVDPTDFVRIKRLLATSSQRDPRKRPKDALQADLVEQLILEFQIDQRIDRATAAVDLVDSKV